MRTTSYHSRKKKKYRNLFQPRLIDALSPFAEIPELNQHSDEENSHEEETIKSLLTKYENSALGSEKMTILTVFALYLEP